MTLAPALGLLSHVYDGNEMIFARIEIYVYYFFRKMYGRPYAKNGDNVAVVIIGLCAIWSIVLLNLSDRVFGTRVLTYLEQSGIPLILFSLPVLLSYLLLYFLLRRKLSYNKKRKLVEKFPNWFKKMGNEIPIAIVLFSFGCFFYSMFFLSE